MVVPVALLVSACLLVGIFPGITAGPYLDAAVRAVLGADVPAYSLKVWHGITIPLLMSLTALVGGTLLYLVLRRYLASGIEGDRQRVESGKSVSVRVDLGGRRIIKKNKKKTTTIKSRKTYYKQT